MIDIVFKENYEARVIMLIQNAHKQGQMVGIATMLQLMKDFEKQKIEITVKGVLEYIESMEQQSRNQELHYEVCKEYASKTDLNPSGLNQNSSYTLHVVK